MFSSFLPEGWLRKVVLFFVIIIAFGGVTGATVAHSILVNIFHDLNVLLTGGHIKIPKIQSPVKK